MRNITILGWVGTVVAAAVPLMIILQIINLRLSSPYWGVVVLLGDALSFIAGIILIRTNRISFLFIAVGLLSFLFVSSLSFP